jgi:hypothetical protein
MNKIVLIAVFLLAGSSAASACTNWLGVPCGPSRFDMTVEPLQEAEYRKAMLGEERRTDPERETRRVAWEKRCKPRKVKGVKSWEPNRWVYAESGCSSGP